MPQLGDLAADHIVFTEEALHCCFIVPGGPSLMHSILLVGQFETGNLEVPMEQFLILLQHALRDQRDTMVEQSIVVLFGFFHQQSLDHLHFIPTSLELQ